MADNVAIVKGVYEALAKGDINTVLGALDEQVEWHLPEHRPLWPPFLSCVTAVTDTRLLWTYIYGRRPAPVGISRDKPYGARAHACCE